MCLTFISGPCVTDDAHKRDILDQLRPWSVHDPHELDCFGPNEQLVAAAMAEIERLRGALHLARAHCGVPDAAEGRRLVIATVGGALGDA